MHKIAIINCFEVSQKCSRSGCIRAFNEKSGSFVRYGDEECKIERVIDCNGCSEKSIESVLSEAKDMKDLGVQSIHLSTCIKSRCNWYNEFIDVLSKDFEVIDYTHRRKEGRNKVKLK